MRGSSLRHRLAAAAALAAVLAASAYAQPPVVALPQDDATTVEGVTVQGIAPVPKVGEDVHFFFPGELDDAAKVAEQRAASARWARSAEREGNGTSGLGPVCRSVYDAQADMARTAQEAAAATRATNTVRRGDPASEGFQQRVDASELARQEAVKAYLAARVTSDRADRRARDLRLMAEHDVDPRGAVAELEERARIRAANGGALPPPEYAHLSITDVTVREEVKELGRGNIVVVEHIEGVIHNNGRTPAPLPPLDFDFVDGAGTITDWDEYSPELIWKDDRRPIPAGGSRAFKASPDSNGYAQRVVVNFGVYIPRMRWRSPDCSGGAPRPGLPPELQSAVLSGKTAPRGARGGTADTPTRAVESIALRAQMRGDRTP